MNPKNPSPFHPFYFFDPATKEMTVIMSAAQIAAVNDAQIPGEDSSESREWGRDALEEISRNRLTMAREHGECSVKILQQKYDGDFV